MKNDTAKRMIVFIDCGDTLVDESTQIFSEDGDVLAADLIPGASEMLQRLHADGYRLALVADGRVKSFHNLLLQHDLLDLFESLAISEALDCAKPDQKMFTTAMAQLGLTNADIGRIIMVGNNIKRDVLGANRMGIYSVLLSFSPRYNMVPEGAEEQPSYTIAMPCELPALLDTLERRLESGLPICGGDAVLTA